MQAKDVRFEIDRKFGKIGVLASFDVGYTHMGRVDWPEGIQPEVKGTPVDVRKYMKGIREESRKRGERGEDPTFYIAIWIDGYLFEGGTAAMLYYIEQASYSGNPPYILEATVYSAA